MHVSVKLLSATKKVMASNLSQRTQGHFAAYRVKPR